MPINPKVMQIFVDKQQARVDTYVADIAALEKESKRINRLLKNRYKWLEEARKKLAFMHEELQEGLEQQNEHL